MCYPVLTFPSPRLATGTMALALRALLVSHAVAQRRVAVAAFGAPLSTAPTSMRHCGRTASAGARRTQRTELTYKSRVGIAMKEGDVDAAFAAHAEASAQGLSLPTETYNVLLNMCAGGNPRGDIFAETAENLREEMERKGIRRDEVTVTTLCRTAASVGDARRALLLCTAHRPPNVKPKIRTFSPAIKAFCDKGDAQGALEAEERARENGLKLTETEYRPLIHVVAAHSAVGELPSLLHRLSGDMRRVSESLAQEIAKAVGKLENRGWRVARTALDCSGRCHVDERVRARAYDIGEEGYRRLKEAIRDFAVARQKNCSQFDKFLRWHSNPSTPTPRVVVDGSNVGLFLQNNEHGEFSFPQISGVFRELKHSQLQEGETPVVFLHSRRLIIEEANRPNSKVCFVTLPVFLAVRCFVVRLSPLAAQEILEELRSNKALFVTPKGANDDWYWLFAAVAAGESGYAVTNDELRDHVAHMMPEPDLFLRWQELHQVRYSIEYTSKQATIHWPLPYTNAIQPDPESYGRLWWLFPVSESRSEWLVAWRPSMEPDSYL